MSNEERNNAQMAYDKAQDAFTEFEKGEAAIKAKVNTANQALQDWREENVCMPFYSPGLCVVLTKGG